MKKSFAFSLMAAFSIGILIVAALAVLRIHATAVVIPLENIAFYSEENAAIAGQYTAVVLPAAVALTVLWIHPAAKWLADNKE